MQTYPVKVTLGGPITIETELPETAIDRLFELFPSVQIAHPAEVVPATSNSGVSATAYAKSWDDLKVAKRDIKQLYKDVAEVGKAMLVYIARHGEDGCTFEDMKKSLAKYGDIQRRMNTIFQVARRMRYVNKNGKGMPPWDTEYINNKPLYTMNNELAAVILSLSGDAAHP